MQMFKLQAPNFITIFYNSAFCTGNPQFDPVSICKAYVVVQFLLWNNLFLNWDKIVWTGTILIVLVKKQWK